MVKVNEIFTSIQGEGPYVGYKQLFVRFCKCNLNCSYCDTDFSQLGAKEYSADELANICNQHTDCHSVSLTGGEPLTEIEFLKEFLPEIHSNIYLETNGTLYKELEQIIDYIEYVSSDIKLPSCTGLQPNWDLHDNFFEIASQKELFAKVVFDSNISEYEIIKTSKLASKYNIELILQPMMKNNRPVVTTEFMCSTLDRFIKLHSRTRLIPQVHKFIDII